MKNICITLGILVMTFAHVQALNVYRNSPTTANVTIQKGTSITFIIEADDPYGLSFAEWYVGTSFQVNHAMTGYYDTDSWSKTFATAGTFDISGYVYNIYGTNKSIVWHITVQEPPIGSIQVTSPNGGENWVSSSTHAITWLKSGNITNIEIQYTKDNGYTWIYLAAPSPSSGTYSWTLPSNTNSTQCKVKILGFYLSQTIYDLSNSTFTISSSITVSSPNGGESWILGSAQNINWSSSGITGNVKIEINGYYPSGGWEVLFSNTANDGSEPWTVSGVSGAEKRIRISSVNNSSLSDISNNNFTIIVPSITVTSPVGGESWVLGTNHNLTWSSTGISGNVKIEINGYYPSGTWETLFASTSNDGSEPWTVSGIAGAEKRIRITSINNPSITGSSNNNFTITNPTALINSPNGGESYIAGTTQSISWSIIGSLTSMDLQYTTDNGNSWVYIGSPSPSAGIYSWPIPYNLNSSLCKVKILGYYNGILVTLDESNATFSVSSSITVSSPNGGESWILGSAQNITWSSSGITGNVKIDVNGNYPSGAWEPLFASIPNDGSEPWTVSGIAGAEKRVRISSISNSSLTDLSNSNFTIIDPSITITSPNGSESWIIGTNQNLTWSSAGISGNVKIEINGYYPSGTWETLFASTSNDGSEPWTVSGIAGAEKRIRITSINSPSISDISNSNFTITNPTALINSPNGGESYIAGSVQPITWSIIGSLTSMDLQYTTDNGISWVYIASPSPSAGFYSWSLPYNLNTSLCKVKILGYYNGLLVTLDESNDTFSVSCSITVSSPNGGESWILGSAQNITWSSSGINGDVKIDVNGNYPSGGWEPLFANVPNDGSEPWTVSGVAGAEKRVRISSVGNSSLSDISNNNFTLINPSITVTSPIGGESWVIGTNHNITWSSVGISGNVKIEINGYYPIGEWETLFASTSNDGSEPWTVSGIEGADKRIRITSIISPDIMGLSLSNFTLTYPTVLINSPNGGESYDAGTTHNITWSVIGNLTSVDLQYTTDNGASWVFIASPSPSIGTYSWGLPYNINSSLCKVKIIGYYNGLTVTLDASDSPFTISCNLTITSPNGSESWMIGSDHNLTWTSSGISGNVKIDINGYYPSGNWDPLFASIPNDGSEPWTVSGMAGPEKRIRITSVNDPGISDISNNNFTMTNQTAIILSPNGGEAYMPGTTQDITWSVIGNLGSIDLQYTTDNGYSWIFIASPSPSTEIYSWQIPGNISSSLCKVKIIGYYNGQTVAFDESNFTFTISNNLMISSPNGGEIWVLGSLQNLTWNPAGISGDVKIEINGYYPTGTWEILYSSIPNDGSEPWTITGTIGTNKRLRISSVNNPSISDISDNDFEFFDLNNIEHEFFDDFTYSEIQGAINNGWIVRDYPGNPGFDDGQWSPNNLQIINEDGDPNNKLLELKAQTNGSGPSTYQSEIRTDYFFDKGTYACQIKFHDIPAQGPDGDAVIQTFFTMSPYIENDPIFSEIDFEYSPNSWHFWGNPQIAVNSWEMAPNDRCHDTEYSSYDGWTNLHLYVDDFKEVYTINNQYTQTHNNPDCNPNRTMGLFLQLWFNDDNGIIPIIGSLREYKMEVDWIYHAKNVELTYSQIQSKINILRAQGVSFRNTMITPVNNLIQNVTVPNGQSKCYGATQNLTIAGGGTAFIVQTGGASDLIAGNKINLLPGTIVQNGGYLHAYIEPSGPWCVLDEPESAVMNNIDEKKTSRLPLIDKQQLTDKYFSIYPNPTCGNFTLELPGIATQNAIIIEIYGIRGELIYSRTLIGSQKYALSLVDYPNGIYFIRVTSDEKVKIGKIVKR